MKQIIYLIVVSMFTAFHALADVSLPTNFVELQGAFKGVGITSKKEAHLLVYRITENNQASGRFFVFLLTENRTKGQIFDGEWIGGEALAISAIGTTPDRKNLQPKLPAAAIVEKSLNQKNGQILRLNKQKNSPLLAESYVFTADSNNIQISTVNPYGLYVNKSDEVRATQGPSYGTSNVSTVAPSLNHEGTFIGVFETDGVVVLRNQVLDNSMIRYAEEQISGILVSITSGRKQELILGTISSDGKAVSVRTLQRKR